MHMLIITTLSSKLQGLSDQCQRKQYAKRQGVPLDLGSNEHLNAELVFRPPLTLDSLAIPNYLTLIRFQYYLNHIPI